MALPVAVIDQIETNLNRELEQVEYRIVDDSLDVTVGDFTFKMKLALTFADVDMLTGDDSVEVLLSKLSGRDNLSKELTMAQMKMIFEDYSEAVQRRQGVELGK